MPGAIPAGAVALFDCSQPATIMFEGSPAVDGGNVDTAGTMAQPTSDAQPWNDTLNLLGKSALIFGNQGFPAVNIPTWLTQNIALGTPFTLVCFGRIDGACVVAEASANVDTSQGFRVTSSLSAGVKVRGSTGLQVGDVLAAGFDGDNVGRILVVKSDGTQPFPTSLSEPTAGTNAFMSNQVSPTSAGNGQIPLQFTGTAPGANALSVPCNVGANYAGTNQVTGAMGFVGLWPRVLTELELEALFAYLNAFWTQPVLSQVQQYNAESVGDSISVAAGTGATPLLSLPYAYMARACANLGSRFGTVQNFGVASARLISTVGTSATPILTQWNTEGLAALSDVLRNLCSLEGGVNDYINGYTASQVAADFLTVATKIINDMNAHHGGGVGLFVYNTTPALPTLYNAAIIALDLESLSTANVHVRLVDAAADVIINQYDGFGLHPNKPGHERWGANMMQQFIAEGL